MIRTISAQPKNNQRTARKATRKVQGAIPLNDAISIAADCIHLFGVECLRSGAIPAYMHITPTALDPLDHIFALSIYVDLINQADEMNFQAGRLRKKIESYVGPINAPFEVVLNGHHRLITPKICLN